MNDVHLTRRLKSIRVSSRYMLTGFTSRGPGSCSKTGSTSWGYTSLRQSFLWGKSRLKGLPGIQSLGSREIRRQRHRTTRNSVSQQTDTDSQMRKQPEIDIPKTPAEAVSKAEEVLDQLVSRQPGTTKVRHRDKALRALDYAGVSQIACSLNSAVQRQCHSLDLLDFRVACQFGAGSPYVLFGSAVLFMLIAWDIFGGTSKCPVKSFYILPHYIDWPVHAWVKVRVFKM